MLYQLSYTHRKAEAIYGSEPHVPSKKCGSFSRDYESALA